MHLKVIILIYFSGFVTAADEGETCVKDGFAGVCVNLGQCPSAINGLKNKKNPQICGFDNSTPIVCCVNANSAQAQPTTVPPRPAATTTRRPSTTTEYTPTIPIYDSADSSGQCEPLPTSLTSPKTGQKAWDKCLEYQEKLVFPCERGVALVGELSRSKHCYHNADELIIGGTDAAANEFTHMVILGYGEERASLQWLCGGALISDRFVLTAGHCIAGNAEIGPVTHVLVGALRRSETVDDSKVFKVNRIIKHPEYKPPSKYHDIALLETEKPVKLSQFLVPACLHVGDAVDDSRASATGWGLTDYRGSTSEVLQKVILNKFSTEECAIKFPEHRLMKQGFDANTQICYGDKSESKDTCQVCSVTQATVCCFDHLNSVAQHTAPPESVATTHINFRSFSTTTEYTPETYDYVDIEHAGQCEPIPTSMTSPRTGQKAWDKCIEYQEQLVFPCERGVAMNGELSRSNHCQHNADVLIVGGRSASDHEFPHMVMLGYGDQRDYLQWLCGGSLISERFVLTAGHCTRDPRIGSVTYVLVGAFRRTEATDRSKIYEVNQIIKYPYYKHYSKYHDIALLETKKEIKLDQFVVPACLHVGAAGDAGDASRASATGWGLTSFGGSASEELQKVMLTKFETHECKVKFPKEKIHLELGFTAHTQMCYGDRNKSRDTCQGDSGGPLQIKSKKINCMYVVIGVTSFGRACGFAGEPAVYTRVASYVPWIESIVWP